MRFVLAVLLAAAGLLLPPAYAAPARDWSQSVSVAPNGVYTIGNPKAKVRLTEYLSYSCPHCGHFAKESDTTLGVMIRSGSTALELHPIALDKLTLAATMLTRCAGPKRFVALHRAIFAGQDQWLNRGYVYLQTSANRYSLDPVPQQLQMAASHSGLDDVATAAGMSSGEIAACFANQAELNRVLAITKAASDIPYTPTFFVNGKKYDNQTWTTLQPILRAAGARG